MNVESFEKKLHIVRDVEGNPNVEGIEIIRQLEREMSKYESFVGLAPFGSTLGGYGSKDSDVDVFILYDEPYAGGNDRTGDYYEYGLWSRVTDLQEEMQKKGQRFDFRLQNVNPDYLLKSLKFWISDRSNLGEYVPESLEAMTRVVTGNKIEKYRNELAAKLSELDPGQKRIVADEILKSLLKRDESSLSKRKRRMPKLSKEEHQKILDDRAKMWRSRVQKIWNLQLHS